MLVINGYEFKVIETDFLYCPCVKSQDISSFLKFSERNKWSIFVSNRAEHVNEYYVSFHIEVTNND